ncbi:MAG: TspO/MBR family protein [Candidatus Eiseniibacteriota bacterium]
MALLKALGAFLLLCGAVLIAGGAITAPAIPGWYAGLVKPAFNPAPWVFSVVWPILFLAMAVAGWLVLRRAGSVAAARTALMLFGAQLALNLLWSALFFGLNAPGAALVEIAVLWLAIAATLVAFWRIDRLAGLLFVPYLAWVSFAAVLNATIWRLN